MVTLNKKQSIQICSLVFSSFNFLFSLKPIKTLTIAAGRYKIPAPIIPSAVLKLTINVCISVFLDLKQSNIRSPAKTPISRAIPGIKKSVRTPNNCPIIDSIIPKKLDNKTKFLMAFLPFSKPLPFHILKSLLIQVFKYSSPFNPSFSNNALLFPTFNPLYPIHLNTPNALRLGFPLPHIAHYTSF